MNKNVDNTKEYKLLSLCSGYGGIELGLELAGFKHRTIAFLEIEAFCCANLVKKMENGAIRPAPIWTDLKTFDAKPFCGLVDIIVGGYPCQPFSAAGTRSGVEDPRHLWPYIFQIVCTTRPIYVFFENVEGHITLGLDAVVKDLQGAGYIVEVGLFSSEETGASHSRKRIFILGKLEYAKSWRPRRLRDQNSEGQRHGIAGPSGVLPELANTNSIRKREMEQKPESNFFDGNRAPIARPGQQQYDWEEPRANTKKSLKSRLGLPTDGYDYRTDLLRALGNGVDPWTAKLAFETLMDKLK